MATARTYEEMETDLEETFGLVPAPMGSIPEDDAVAEWPTFKKYTVGESEIPAKYRELMGLAVAANIKCPYCTHFHREAARMHGATDEELAEAYSLASFTARYSAMLHAQSYDLDTFKREFEQMATHLQANMGTDD